MAGNRIHRPMYVAWILLGAFGLGTALGGDLNPPAGPIRSTMKPLDQVEPRIAVNGTKTPGDNDSMFRITEPGSYFLIDNLVGGSGRNGIEIDTSGVTLDLMGFDVAGLPGSRHGILATAKSGDIVLRNGSVRGWGMGGVNLTMAELGGILVEDIRAADNLGMGIEGVSTGVVRNCTAVRNSRNGLHLIANVTVTHCATYSNGDHGISVTGWGSTIEQCTSVGNGDFGIFASRSAVLHCSARDNALVGIYNSGGGSIIECTSNSNGTDGIEVGDHCQVLNNQCDSNGDAGDGAGIRVTGTGNRVDGNRFSRNDRGLRVNFAGNFIVRNFASANSTIDFDILGVQTIGPILNTSGTITSENPWANFEY